MDTKINEKTLLDGFVQLDNSTHDIFSVVGSRVFEWSYDYDWWTGNYRIIWKTDSGISGEFEIDPWYRPCHNQAKFVLSDKIAQWDNQHPIPFFLEEEVKDLVEDRVLDKLTDLDSIVEIPDWRENFSPEEYYSGKSKFHFKEFAKHAQSPREQSAKVNIFVDTTDFAKVDDDDLPF